MRTAPSKLLLAVDTSTRLMGISLYDGAQVLYEAVWNTQNHHTVELAPAVEDAFRKTGLTTDDLGALAVATGPGSFTGLRIGIALVKGVALAKKLPTVGVSSFDMIAAAQPMGNLPLAAILRAGRKRLSVGWYTANESAWIATGKMKVLEPAELIEQTQTRTQLCGELNQAERELFSSYPEKFVLSSPAYSLRRPSFLAEVAWLRWQNQNTQDPATLAPVYLQTNSLNAE